MMASNQILNEAKDQDPSDIILEELKAEGGCCLAIGSEIEEIDYNLHKLVVRLDLLVKMLDPACEVGALKIDRALGENYCYGIKFFLDDIVEAAKATWKSSDNLREALTSFELLKEKENKLPDPAA